MNAVVILFGWAGASHKNLSKYSAIYEELGYTTVQYMLPTRFIFTDTEHIPDLMENLVKQMTQKDLLVNRPLFIHCLSDTGSMCFQGLDIATKQGLNISGVVWDSCPAPYPEMTIPRVTAFLIVNWMCCRKDKIGMLQSLNRSYRLLIDRAWPNLLRKWKGEPVTMSLMQGNTYIYSCTVLYLPYPV